MQSMVGIGLSAIFNIQQWSQFMSFSPQLIWFLVGVAFLVGEMALPGFILIFFTAGCWITAIVTWSMDISLTAQVVVFVINSLILLFAFRTYSIKTFKGTTRDDEDDHYMDSKIGKTAQVTKTISPKMPGEIKVMGSFWRAVAEEEIVEGSSVIIESQASEDGLSFRVKSL
jgi:membrane protein implicated in regulation of membrane protease activity